MSTVKSKKYQVGTDATASNNFTIYQPGTPDGTLRIGVGNADSPTEVAQFNSTGIVGDGSQLTGLPAPAALTTASGSAPSYSARAWVNFNGTGTVAIRASGNVSSITDQGGTGLYAVNFTTAMPDINYCVAGMKNAAGEIRTGVNSTGSVEIRTTNSSGTLIDMSEIMVAIFR